MPKKSGTIVIKVVKVEPPEDDCIIIDEVRSDASNNAGSTIMDGNVQQIENTEEKPSEPELVSNESKNIKSEPGTVEEAVEGNGNEDLEDGEIVDSSDDEDEKRDDIRKIPPPLIRKRKSTNEEVEESQNFKHSKFDGNAVTSVSFLHILFELVNIN